MVWVSGTNLDEFQKGMESDSSLIYEFKRLISKLIELTILKVWKFRFLNALSPGEGDVKHINQDAIIIKFANISR